MLVALSLTDALVRLGQTMARSGYNLIRLEEVPAVFHGINLLSLVPNLSPLLPSLEKEKKKLKSVKP